MHGEGLEAVNSPEAVKIIVKCFVEEYPYPWREGCYRARVGVLAGMLRAVQMAWKGESHGHLVVRLIRNFYNVGAVKTTATAMPMGCGLMGAHAVLGAVLEGGRETLASPRS